MLIADQNNRHIMASIKYWSTAQMHKTSQRDEMVRDMRWDAEAFWAETQDALFWYRDVDHFVQDEIETRC